MDDAKQPGGPSSEPPGWGRGDVWGQPSSHDPHKLKPPGLLPGLKLERAIPEGSRPILILLDWRPGALIQFKRGRSFPDQAALLSSKTKLHQSQSHQNEARVLVETWEVAMPRYFFHQHIGDCVIWDEIGIDLPDPELAFDASQAAVLWADILAERPQPDQILVITDALGRMLFVSAR